ncbi:MAG: UDP-N-acetylmuramoyl-L-alanyl-D-glutamate--2,6-diaminopimelate ligase [Bacteroidota bacterium]
MKLLRDILYKAGIVEISGSTLISIASICSDSRKAETNSLFIATCGTQNDGHEFIKQAIIAGAVAVVCEEFPSHIDKNVTYIKVNDSNESLGIIASNFFDNPSEKLKIIGITGTNGKTTVATLLYYLFLSLGYNVGLLSTIVYRINEKTFRATHTTPDAIQINQLLMQMVNAGCEYCFMEVSSHAVIQKRISGLNFSGAVFTNITHDHLDYHKTFDEYIKAKKKFFDNLNKNSFALINKDDQNGLVMIQNTYASKKTYGLKSTADFRCKVIENQFTGLLLNVDGTEMWSKLIGSFNAYNLLAVYATAVLLGEEKMNVLTKMSNLNSVEGRFQYIRSESGITGIVDYSHTPDALVNVIKTIQNIRSGNGKIITVVGCGGNRDTLKRPVMARIACEESDKVILTSDNPRNEDPNEIIQQMQVGVERKYLKKVLSIVDRREAIKTAYSLASAGDIILVAGKGHEKYQDIKGVKHPFDDMQMLIENLKMFTE